LELPSADSVDTISLRDDRQIADSPPPVLAAARYTIYGKLMVNGNVVNPESRWLKLPVFCQKNAV
jgi:hypothetical protein